MKSKKEGIPIPAQFFMTDLDAGSEPKIPQLPHEEFYMSYGIHLPTATIDLWGGVDAESCQTALQGLHLMTRQAEFLAKGKKPVYPTVTVNINSQGGDWYAGMALHDALVAYPGKVVTVVQGQAMSMGSIILQAGDVRKMHKYSTIMVHNGHDSAEGNINEVKRWTKHAEAICKQMYEVYANKSGKTTRYWKTKCGTDYILDADKSLKEGLVDEII